MPRCKECIHEKVCRTRGFPSIDEILKDGCPHYKDKSLLVEVVRCKECIHRNKPVRCALWYATVGDVEYFAEKGTYFYCEWGETQEQAERKLREVGE